MKKGIFITFEGPDGSGKTTVSTGVTEKLIEQGYPVVYTREPGGIDIAEQIRGVILDPRNTAMDVRTEALLYAASRRQHLTEKVLPALEEGKIVLCDRFLDSSLAYQGVGRGIGIDEVYRINQFAIDTTMPDLTFYLDISPDEGLARIQTRAFKDRLDQESLDFHYKVAEGYRQVTELFPDRIVKIDATRKPEEIINEITERILAYVQQ